VVDARREAFEPDYAVPPGETLRETLESIGMSQADLARRAELSTKHVNQIIQGEAPITPETALALERVTRVPARIWNGLEANFQAQRIRIAQRRRLDPDDLTWLRRFPIAELARRNAIAGSNDPHLVYDQLLAFFGVASRTAWERVWRSPEAAFRQSPAFQADEFAVATWLRLGELDAGDNDTEPFDRPGFRATLDEIRGLMTSDPREFHPRMVDLCAQVGVALVIVAEVKGARASGASRWLSPSKAIIQLSLRYRWEDHFWFSFFHEGGHLYLHGKRRAFIDLPSETQGSGSSDGKLEVEANRFAADLLIPPSDADRLKEIETRAEILDLASELEIPPGIVVGRMQREGYLGWHQQNDLRRRFVLTES
jgi:HTH-type transcriptional regulator / antitoxin HigA